MSQSTEPHGTGSPVDAAANAYLAPAAERFSALTAAGSMGRFLAYHPEYATVAGLGWAPHYDGRLSVNGALLHTDTCALMYGIAAVLGITVTTRASVSEKHGPVVSLQSRGFYDGAEWNLWAMVSAEQFEEYHQLAQAVAA